MSTELLEDTLPSPNRGLQLVLSPENCYPSLFESPDSNCSISNVSDREASSFPDSSVNECSPVDKSYNTNSAAKNTFNVSPVNSGHGVGLLSQLSSSEASHRGYPAGDCCFLSSGEMFMRVDSSFLDDQSSIGLSSLDKSSNHRPECPAAHAEFSQQAINLLDVNENSTERDTDENTGHPCLGVTLPSENERGLLMTFTICERSAQHGKEPIVTSAETELLPYFSGRATLEQGKAFVFTPSAVQSRVNGIRSSTPLPVTGKKISRLLSFSESLGSANRPALHPATRRQMSVTCEQCSHMPPSAGLDNKMKVKKSDFCNVKPKIVTRSQRHVAVPGSSSQHKSSQTNVNNKYTITHRGTTIRGGSPKMSGSGGVGGHCPVVNGHSSTTLCSNASSEHTVSGQVPHTSPQSAGSRPSFKKFFVKSVHIDSKASPKSGVSNKINIRSGSSLNQVRPPVYMTQPQRSSESSSLTSRPPKEKRTVSSSSTIQKTDILKGRTKPGTKRAIQAEETNSCTSSTEVPKPSLSARSSKSTTAGVSWDDCKSRFQRRTSITTPRSQPPAASSRSCIAAVRQKQGRSSMSKAEKMVQSKQPTSASIQRTGPLHRTSSSAGTKPQLNGSPLPQTPTRPSLIGPPRKILGLSKGLTDSSVHNELGPLTGQTPVSGAAVHKQTQFKSVGLKARLISRNNTSPSLTTACKPAASTCKGASVSTVSLLKRTLSTRHARPSSVDKNKSKSSSQQHPQRRASQPNQRNGPLDGVPAALTEGEKKEQSIQTDCSSNFDAVSTILQKALAKFDDATKKCRGLSQELNNLRGELVVSVSSSEFLEKELHELLQAKWDEGKALMQQQMNELEARHEAMKQELESKHEQLQYVKQQHEMSLEELRNTRKDAVALSGQIQDLTATNNALIEKLTAEEDRREELAQTAENDSHILYLEQELESLKVMLDIKNKQLHEQEKKLMEMGQLTEKNVTLDDSLKKVQQEHNDSHILYLEQELESVKVVLDIKNKQLHQLEKRLMEMDQLTEKNVMLDETLKKAQQENEDLKARMERQAALSRQLSTEQATLQEHLHKESQLNKRLSMENEELLWKLNNGDLSSSLKMSPTSSTISHSFTLQSPHSSSLSSSSALSPR